MASVKEERRSPDRHRVMTRFLRRVAVFSLFLAAAILVVPRALLHFGMVGPKTEEVVGAARQALTVARGYGATAALPAYAAAEKQLAAAEALQKQGRGYDARRAAEQAHAQASEAQQQALVQRDGQRVRAKQVIDQLDKRTDELEDLYTEKTKGLPKPRVSELLSKMKSARATAAALVLAWEGEDYAKVVAGEAEAVGKLEALKQELESI